MEKKNTTYSLPCHFLREDSNVITCKLLLQSEQQTHINNPHASFILVCKKNQWSKKKHKQIPYLNKCCPSLKKKKRKICEKQNQLKKDKVVYFKCSRSWQSLFIRNWFYKIDLDYLQCQNKFDNLCLFLSMYLLFTRALDSAWGKTF